MNPPSPTSQQHAPANPSGPKAGVRPGRAANWDDEDLGTIGKAGIALTGVGATNIKATAKQMAMRISPEALSDCMPRAYSASHSRRSTTAICASRWSCATAWAWSAC